MALENSAIDPNMLSELVPIKALSPDYISELAGKSEIGEAKAGSVLFKPGDKLARILYVLKGSIEISSDGGAKKVITGGQNAAKLPLEQGKEHKYQALAKTDVNFLKIDPNLLDIMLTWEQSGGYEVQELDSSESESNDDWMSRILQAKVFHRIPPANIQSIFMRMKAEQFGKGEAVIKQGEEGGSFYIIREGVCKVVRQTRKNPEGVVLAKLVAGDNFGEEALISGGKRNASVIMLGKGSVMSLSKNDFLELMNEPILNWVDYSEALDLVAQGGMWIDVRLPSEFQARNIKGSVNLPLPILRSKLDKLDSNRKLVICCDTGRRSSTATYLLTQNGFDACVLQDGLSSIDDQEQLVS